MTQSAAKLVPPTKRPKVAFMIQHVGRQGGMENSTLQILIRLAKMGWEIELFSFALQDWPDSLPITWHRIAGNSFPIRFLKNIWFMLVVPRKVRKLLGKECITMTSGISVANADVRVMHFLHQEFNALVNEGKVKHANARTRLHNLYQVAINALYVWLEKRWLAKSKTLIAISQRVADNTRSHQKSNFETPIEIIYHGTDFKTVDYRKAPLKNKMVRLIFVGALERKGIEKSLRVLAKLRDLPWHFQVLGEGDIFRWRNFAKSLEIDDRVDFLGVKYAEPFLRKADILILPSIYEPFGLTITEAAACGCIPLGSLECGAMEIWKNREEWLYLSSQDKDEDWACALRKLISSEETRVNALAAAQDQLFAWTWDKAAMKYDQALKTLLRAR